MAHGVKIVPEFVVRIRLDYHPCAVFCQSTADMCCGSDWVAHIVEAIEDGDEVVFLPGKLFRSRYQRQLGC